jgi:hypothetical protein
MVDHGSKTNQSTSRADVASTPPTLRAGIIAAVLWAVIGLATAWLSAQAGAPAASGWLALLSGPVALVIVGRRYDIRRLSDWTGAGVVAVLAVVGFGSAAIFFLTLLTAGSGFSDRQAATPEGVPPGGIGVASSDPTPTGPLDPTPTPHVPLAMDPSDVTHIVAAIDELATADGDETIEWVNREGEWVTTNMDVAFVENEAVSTYTDLTIAALEKMGRGDFDLQDEVDAIQALRDEIAALAPGAVPTT